MKKPFEIYPIGIVCKGDDGVWIDINSELEEALWGLDSFSHIWVLYWFHQNDTLEQRQTMRVRPRKNPANPLTGVFATHSPVRPNLIAMTRCKLFSIEGTRLHIDEIDAMDRSPVIDIKCYIPDSLEENNVRVPQWIKAKT